jgi:diguanylate cyclase (GGDEF)-like protein/PAS domain S-box-containing protein
VTWFRFGRSRRLISAAALHLLERDGGGAATARASSSSLSLASGLRRASVVCAGVVAALAGLVLLGWMLHIEILTRLVAGLAPMDANTAVCLLLGSVSLLGYLGSAPGSGLRRAAAACAVLVIVVGAATLVEYALGVRLGIDQLLFHDRGAPNAPYPGRPAANTALGFALDGGALLLWEVRVGKWWPSNTLVWASAALGSMALIGYANGAGPLIVLSAHQHFALNSAALLAVLWLGLLLGRSDRGEMALLASDGHGGLVGRRLLAVGIALPVELAMLTLAGQRLGLFATAAGGWLFAGAVTVIVAAVAWLVAAGSKRADRERRRGEDASARLAAIVESCQDAIITLSPEGVIETWNAAAEHLYSYTAEEVVGQPRGMLWPAEWNARRLDALAGDTIRFEGPAMRRDGSIFDAGATVSPVRNGDVIVGASCIVRDITERKRTECELQRLAHAAEHGSDAVVSIDLEGRICHWNPGAVRLYGWSASEAAGRPLDELLTVFGDEPRDEIARMLAGEDAYQFETQRRRKDATIIDVLLTISPWTVDGSVVGVTSIAIDVSERKRIERAREQALAELEEAQRTARVGSWSWGPTADEASWSAQMYEIFARDATSGPATSEDFYAYVHPDDRGRLAGYTRAFGGGPAFELDYRIVAGDGSQRTLHALGHRDSARVGCYVGTVQDVTELRAAEVALRDAEERFRQAFDEAPIGMALISEDGRLEQANTALGVICGRTRDELLGVQLRELLHPADADSASEALRALGAGAIDQLAMALRIIPTVGSPLEISVNGTLLQNGTGHLKRVLYQFQDVTERKRYEEQLQFMADHDPLTGLQNRRKFESELDRHVEHVKRYGPEGALLVLDIDHFKTINDTLGHNAGDQLIVSISSVLRGRLRTSDVLARLGGDEFAVLLPKADEAEAAQVAGALVNAVRSNTTLLCGERKKVTTSIGVAMFNTNVDELTGETIVIEADLAMYDAKEAGRDSHAFYATSEHRISRTKARLTWVSRIEQALEEDRFALLAQPILDLHTGEVRQHELLLRMLDDNDDLIPPASFLYIAERFGLIAKLDEWVANRAIELIEQRPELQLGVNVSGRSLGDRKLLQAIDKRLRASSIDPTRLIFEVTETAAVANITHAQAFAQQLRDRGCRFALDDFGAGFGSFYYLKHLPFDYVKIDGEFVQHATSGHVDQLVIEAVVRIAQGLGKETIAEFVTDEQTKRMVTRLGVDYAQGYHIGKPAPIAELIDASGTHLELPSRVTARPAAVAA